MTVIMPNRICCVPYKGVIQLLIWTALLHSAVDYDGIAFITSCEIYWYGYPYDINVYTLLLALAIISIASAITYLLYPVAGLLAELYCSRYKVMIVGNVLAVVGSIIVVPATIILLLRWDIFDNKPVLNFGDSTILITATLTIGIILHQFGLGLFEANAIQFGVDQLQFASNDDLSKFVNWYYWAITSLQIIPGLYFRGCVLFTIASLFCLCCKRHYIIEPAGHVNPVKHIVKVLRYARHHTAPVFRSAFTYGEGPPSRLDLAKDRYGGPYTTEEVEDVKSFGRILLLLSSQFGILLVGGVSLFDVGIIDDDDYYWVWSTINEFFGGKLVWATVPVVVIPIYMTVIRPYFQRYIPSMIKRMGISLVLAIISLSLLIPANHCHFREIVDHGFIDNSTCTIDYHDTTTCISLGISAQITGSLAYLLNFLTVLEFILAQGPRSMQGLLIGIWYAYQAVAVLVQLANVIFIYHSSLLAMIKLPLAVTSFITYVIVACWYRYRERNEASDINQQNIIEEYTERQLLRKPRNTHINYDSLIIESQEP